MPIPPEWVGSGSRYPRVAVLTGAGISAESGIPTFREAQTGLWEKYDPAELATPQAFSANPQLVWKWYNWRRQLILKAVPNAGHRALATLERHLNRETPRFILITQNIDGLHQRAGSCKVIELHGNIMREKCSQCPTSSDPPPNPTSSSEIPVCPHCGGLFRPDVVWFGESLPPNAHKSARHAAENSDLFLSIGTSAVVQPAASLPLLAFQNGAKIIELNPSKTPVTPYAQIVLQGQSGLILPDLIDKIWGIELDSD